MNLTALLAVSFLAVQQPQPPALLEQALKTLPGVRLLVPATDLREYTQDELQKFGYWPPWAVQDTDRDQRPDVVAVVVKPSPSGAEFGVIAVHARAPREVHWVVPFDVDPINGVTKGRASDIGPSAFLHRMRCQPVVPLVRRRVRSRSLRCGRRR